MSRRRGREPYKPRDLKRAARASVSYACLVLEYGFALTLWAGPVVR